MTFLKTIHSYAHLSYKLAHVLQWEAPVFSLVAKPPIQSSEFIAFNYLSLLLIVIFRALNNILSSPFTSSLTFTPPSIPYYKKNRIYFFRIPVLNLFYFWEIVNFSVLLLLALVKWSVIHKNSIFEYQL